AVLNASYLGAWAADIELDGDMDVVLGAATGPPLVLRRNADRTWTPIRPLEGISGLRRLVWADLDGDGFPDLAAVDGSGHLAVFKNLLAAHYRRLDLGMDPGQILDLTV